MMQFKKKYENLILNSFKINLVGPNGCGKTKMTKEILKELKIDHIYIRLYDLLDLSNIIQEIQEKATEDALNFWRKDKLAWEDVCENNVETIYECSKNKTISNLFSIMECTSDIIRKFYIIFDDIDDPHFITHQNYVKGDSQHKLIKNFKRLISLSNHFHFKLILISNFDIKNSEVVCQDTLDYDDMITLFFPRATINEQKEYLMKIIESEQNKEIKRGNKIEDENQMIVDFEHKEINENIDDMRDYNTPSKMDVDEKKPSSTSVESFLNITLNSFNWSIVNLNKIINSGLDIFNNVKEIKDVTNYNKQVRNLVRREIGEKLYINEKITDESNEIERSKSKFMRCTESLSRCQKLLIVSAFIAGELNPHSDSKILKSVKMGKKSHRLKEKYCSIKKEVQSFSVHRLTAIYCSLYSILFDKKLTNVDLGIEFMCDLNTLLKENLIRRIGSESNSKKGLDHDLTKKLVCNVNFIYVDLLAKGFELNLDNFIGIDFIC